MVVALRVLVNYSRWHPCYKWLAWLDWLAARDSTMTSSVVEPDTPWWSLDITSVKTYCSLLTSTFQEVLRHRSMGTSIRQVMQDNAERVIHKDPSVWGTGVDNFNPRRFMKDEVQ